MFDLRKTTGKIIYREYLWHVLFSRKRVNLFRRSTSLNRPLFKVLYIARLRVNVVAVLKYNNITHNTHIVLKSICQFMAILWESIKTHRTLQIIVPTQLPTFSWYAHTRRLLRRYLLCIKTI